MKYDTSYRIINSTPDARSIIPSYPQRVATVLGMPAVNQLRNDLQDLFPLKYACLVRSIKTRFLFEAVVVSHLSLEDYLSMKGYQLVSLEKPATVALPHERSSL
jgi:hypothetical protein